MSQLGDGLDIGYMGEEDIRNKSQISVLIEWMRHGPSLDSKIFDERRGVMNGFGYIMSEDVFETICQFGYYKFILKIQRSSLSRK